jgi:drug/metabolite transporter (DMT)-like permease
LGSQIRLPFSSCSGGGFLFLGCHGLLAWAEQSVPSGMAALLSSTVSLWAAIILASVALVSARGKREEQVNEPAAAAD